jgi:hypothetical protein
MPGRGPRRGSSLAEDFPPVWLTPRRLLIASA